MNKFLLVTTFLSICFTIIKAEWLACSELSPALRLPCKCRIEDISIDGQSTSIGMNCDHVVFTSDSPQIPKGAPITTFSQRHAGQLISSQVRISN